MLKLAICDDEKVFRNDLKRIVSTELDLCGIDYRITEFSCGEELLAASAHADFQVLFLDVEMKKLDGVETARRIRKHDKQSEIIFVTSHPDFVFQGYEVRALNYIIKPYEQSKIVSVLHTALESLELSPEKYYIIEQRGKSIRLLLSSVKYFVSDRRVIHAVTPGKSYDFYQKLNDLELQLGVSFVRIHNRYLINMKYLQEIHGNTAVVAGESLPVSRTYRQNLSIAFAKYMLYQENMTCQTL